MSPFPLPDWLPWWIQLAIVLLVVLFALALLLMPFAVFGLKGRLLTIENRIEDLGADVRMLAGRIAESGRAPSRPLVEDDSRASARPASQTRPRGPAPLPPRPVEPGFDRRDEPEPAAEPQRRSRDPDDRFEPDEERPPPSQPLRAPRDRSPLDRDRDPDRLRYSGKPRSGSGEREEPSLRWPPR